MTLQLPPLANLCSYAAAARTGTTVEETVHFLHRCLYIESQMLNCFTAHFNATPEWEAKCAFALHLYHDAEHSAWLRKRVAEMRTPPLHLDQVPDPALQLFMQELLTSTNTLELLVGLYQVLKLALITSIQEFIAHTNPLANQPTVRILEFILLEEQQHLLWGQAALQAFHSHYDSNSPIIQQARQWQLHLESYLAYAGGISGNAQRPDQC